MNDCKLCTNITTACNGKKRKNSIKKERRRGSQDKPYFVRKSAWVSLTGIHILMFIFCLYMEQ